MEFGDILRKLLKENGITQRQLAKTLNMPESTLGNYINNVREPDFATLKRFASHFSVSLDYLLNYQSDVINDDEDEILHLFNSLPKKLKALYIEQGKLLASYDIAENHIKASLKEVHKKEFYD